MALVRELAPTIMRYPGGNFVSGYDWEDGVGPVGQAAAPARLRLVLDRAEQFGTNEFIDWCRAAGIEPMLAVNLGTRGPAGRRAFHRVPQLPGRHGAVRPAPPARLGKAARREVLVPRQRDGRPLADRRQDRAGIRPHRHRGRQGHEMGRRLASNSPPAARRAARCRPSAPGKTPCSSTPSTMSNGLSLHTYLNNYADDTPAFLASPDLMDSFIEEVVAIADAVAARRRSAQAHHAELRRMERAGTARAARARPGSGRAGRWRPRSWRKSTTCRTRWRSAGPAISLLNHADRVRCACLAQLVNVIAPIMTETGGGAWRQTIFWPFADFSNHGRGARAAGARRKRHLRRRLPRSGHRGRPDEVAGEGRAIPEARGRARRRRRAQRVRAEPRHRFRRFGSTSRHGASPASR